MPVQRHLQVPEAVRWYSELGEVRSSKKAYLIEKISYKNDIFP